MTAMQPVVVDPKISFTQLDRGAGQRRRRRGSAPLVRDQFLAKLQRKKRHLSETSRHATSRPAPA